MLIDGISKRFRKCEEENVKESWKEVVLAESQRQSLLVLLSTCTKNYGEASAKFVATWVKAIAEVDMTGLNEKRKKKKENILGNVNSRQHCGAVGSWFPWGPGAFLCGVGMFPIWGVDELANLNHA